MYVVEFISQRFYFVFEYKRCDINPVGLLTLETSLT